MDFLKNKIVQILLVVCAVVAICMLVKLNAHVSIGSSGINAGIERTPN